MRVAIMQPTYLPWVGYFNMIDQVDQFVLYDTVQYQHKSWQSRNRIRGRDGATIWLTVPTQKPHRQPIMDIRIAGDEWRRKHWRTIQTAYSHAKHWDELEAVLEPIYQHQWTTLSSLTNTLIRNLAQHIGIQTTITSAWSIPQRTGKLERIEDILRATTATEFLEPLAVDFLPDHGIANTQTIWHHYTPAPYTQGVMPWQPSLSTIDLIAHHGPNTLDVIRQGYHPHKCPPSQPATNAAHHDTGRAHANVDTYPADYSPLTSVGTATLIR